MRGTGITATVNIQPGCPLDREFLRLLDMQSAASELNKLSVNQGILR